MQANKLPLPPYGLIVSQYQKEAIRLEFPVYIFVGKDAFHNAKLEKSIGGMAMALPPDKEVTQFTWPINDQKIVVIDTGDMTANALKRICFNLLTHNPRVIFLYSDTGNEFFLNKKDNHNE